MTENAGISTGMNLSSLQSAALLEDRIFKQWFDLTLPLTLCGDDNATSLPKYHVNSNLYIEMIHAAASRATRDGGIMYAYFGLPFTGKSTAGKKLIRELQKQKGDNYPTLYLNISANGNDVFGAFRAKLSVPNNMPDEGWLDILFRHLSNKIDPKNSSGWKLPSWVPSLPSCSCDAKQAVPAAYANNLGDIPPIIVIDQLNYFDLKMYHQLTRIYQLAFENRVVMYILTDNERAANLIVAMNGDKRVTPVPNRYERNAFETVQADGGIFGTLDGIQIATGTTWKQEEWTRETQHECLVLAFPDEAADGHNLSDDGFFEFLVEGENPHQAMQRANDHFGPPNDVVNLPNRRV